MGALLVMYWKLLVAPLRSHYSSSGDVEKSARVGTPFHAPHCLDSSFLSWPLVLRELPRFSSSNHLCRSEDHFLYSIHQGSRTVVSAEHIGVVKNVKFQCISCHLSTHPKGFELGATLHPLNTAACAVVETVDEFYDSG